MTAPGVARARPEALAATGGRRGFGIACALLSATGFGLNPPIAAMLNAHGFTPVESVLVRTVLMTVVAAVLVGWLRRPIRVGRDAWWPLAGITAGTAGLSLCYLSSVAFIPVGLAVIILYVFPLLVLVLSPWLEGERLGIRRLGLALVAFCGLAIAIGPSFGALDPRGIGLAVCAALSAVVIFFGGRLLAGRVDEAVNAFWVHLLGAPVVGAVAIATGAGQGWLAVGSGTAPGAVIAAVALLGVTYVGAYLFMVHGLRHAAPSQLTPYYNIEPFVSIAAAAVLVGERLDANQYLGGALVIGALTVSGLGALRPAGKNGSAP